MGISLPERCNVIEECYEFMLGYAGQGLPAGSGDGQIRDFLTRAAEAIQDLETAVPAAEPYTAFREVIVRDARDSLAAVNLVLAQPAISSQLVDNLNASIHLRALLTDLFLIDEILKSQSSATSSASS